MMKMNDRQHERGFTLVELIASIGASAIIMLTVMSLMGMTHREWLEGMNKAELVSETALATGKMTEEIRSASVDSVRVSANKDTLKIGSGTRFYKDGLQSLIYKNPSRSFTYLEGMLEGFTLTTPVIQAPGDTLKGAIKVTLTLQNSDVQDSTSVLIVPRAK